MRFLSLLITLAIIGYGLTVYLDSDSMPDIEKGDVKSKPEAYINHARQATEQATKSIEQQQKLLDEMKK